MAEPGGLSLGVAPGVALALVRSRVQCHLAGKVADQPRHAVRLHGGKRRIETAAAERAHLVQRTGGEHGIEAGVDAAVKLRPIRIQEDLDRPVR